VCIHIYIAVNGRLVHHVPYAHGGEEGAPAAAEEEEEQEAGQRDRNSTESGRLYIFENTDVCLLYMPICIYCFMFSLYAEIYLFSRTMM